MSLLNFEFSKRGAMRLVLILGAVFALAMPALAQKVKAAPMELDKLAFSGSQFRMSETFADSDAIKDKIGYTDAIAAFKAQYGPAWHFLIDERIGRVNLLEGGAIPFIPGAANTLKGSDFDAPCGNASCVPMATVEKLARDFLTANQKIFLVDPNDLELDPQGSRAVWDSIYTARFQWKHQGVPVEGGSIYFIINNGNLVQVGMQKIGNITLDTTPKLTPEAAWTAMDGYVNGIDPEDEVVNGGTLVILPVTPQGQDAESFNGAIGTQIDYVLAYKTAFRRQGQVGTWEAVVDANTGAILQFHDSNAYGHVQGGVYKTDKISGYVETTMPFPYVDYGTSSFCDFAGDFSGTTGTSTMNGRTGSTGNVGGVYITDKCGTITQAASSGLVDFGNSSASGTNCTVPSGKSAGDTHSSRTQYWNVTEIKAKAYSYLPTNTWLQGHLQDKVNLTGTCNAYWDGTKLNFFQTIAASFGNCGNTGELPGVSLHEWGHGMDTNDGSGSGTDNKPIEARADWTALLQTHLSCAGAGFLTSQCSGYGDTCTACTGVRDADSAKHSNTSAWTPQNKGSVWASSSSYCQTSCTNCYYGPCGWEDHCESGIATQALWDFVNRDLIAAPTSLDLVTAWQVADRLFYASMSTAINMYTCSGSGTKTSNGCGSGSIYTTYRAMDDSGDGVANGTPHAAAIFAALNRHGIACGASTDATNLNETSCAALTTPSASGSAGDSQTTLNWAAVTNATRYFVFRNETDCSSGFTRIATVTATTYNDTLCYNGVTYNYRIQAATAADQCISAMSACTSLTPAGCTTPGAPTISAVTDVSACAQSGVTVTFTAGSPAGTSYNLLKDGTSVVTGYTSGATYSPGDTSSHAYIVQAVCGSNTANSAGVAGTDANGTPGAPTISGITDNNACAQDGVKVAYTAGSPAGSSYNLLRNGTSVVTGYTSGAVYNPGGTTSYTYTVQAVSGSCTATSTGTTFADANGAPGAPTISAVADVSACALSGIKVTFSAGSPAGSSYNLLKDGTSVVTGYTSGTTYSPGDTSSHTYIVQAVSGACTTNSTGMAGTDANGAPGAPTISAVADVSACAQSGITVTYTAGTGATSHNLLRDGSVVATGYTSGATYLPGDTSSHTYIVQAVSGACTTNSTGMAGTDANGAPGAPTISAVADVSACAQSGITVTYTAGTGATSHNLLRDGSVVASGYTSGATYLPGDTSSHTYIVQAVKGACTTNSTGAAGIDLNNAVGAPAITSITDNDACAATGIKIAFTAGSGATSHNLLRDSVVVVVNYHSGDTYVPGDSAIHTYMVQASNGTCTANSSGSAFADAAGPCSPPVEDAPGTTPSTAQSWGGDKITQSWPPVSGATYYTLYRGMFAQLPYLLNTGTDSCTVYSGPSTSAADSTIPAAGQLFWYLVTAGNSNGEGPAGNATAGARIVNSSGNCP